MEILVTRLKDGLEYLTSQGKKVTKIVMNPEIYETLMKENKEDIEITSGGPFIFGILIESGDNIEKYEYILSEAT